MFLNRLTEKTINSAQRMNVKYLPCICVSARFPLVISDMSVLSLDCFTGIWERNNPELSGRVPGISRKQSCRPQQLPIRETDEEIINWPAKTAHPHCSSSNRHCSKLNIITFTSLDGKCRTMLIRPIEDRAGRFAAGQCKPDEGKFQI